MQVLLVAPFFPMPDRSAGDLRLSKIVSGLAAVAAVDYCALSPRYYAATVGSEAAGAYEEQLRAKGIGLVGSSPLDAIKAREYDLVFFEFSNVALKSYCNAVRLLLPRARIVVDSVDVQFNRLLAKARLTGDPQDMRSAIETRRAEVAAYRRADVVIAVSDEDRAVLRRVAPELAIEVIPTFHGLCPRPPGCAVQAKSLIFIGGFAHAPNTDAVTYFVRDIMPIIERQVPDVFFTIVGNEPPQELVALARHNVAVTGYVADTTPHLHSHMISVAPLRYGGGMKGKVGEAMAHGLPVVATTFGAEGFGFTPGEHVLVADDAEGFATHVVSLLRDETLRERIGAAGYEFIRQRYSDDAVATRVGSLLDRTGSMRPKRLGLAVRAGMHFRSLFDRHIAWRFS